MFTFEQLSALRAVIDEGTFDAAAGRLNVTASAVSQRIKAMERSAGKVLVQRTNPAQTTSAGDIALRFARQAELLDHDAAAALGDDGSGFERGAEGGSPADAARRRPVSISLAVNADSLATWFLDALAPFTAATNAVVDLHRDDEEFTTSLLRSGTVMAAVTSTPEPVQGCTSELLGTLRYRAVCSPTAAARWGYKTGDLGWLAQAPAVNFDRKDDLQGGFLRSVGVKAQAPTHYVPTSADFARAVVLGFGWGMLAEQQCSAPLAAGDLLELAPDHPTDVSLFWQRWNLDSPLLTALTAAIRTGAARSLIQ